MIGNADKSENSVLPFLISPLTEAREPIEFCQNFFAKFSKKGESPCTKEFPDVKNKRQLLDYYLKGICSPTSQYGIYTIEIRSPNAFHDRYLIQTDDVDIEFSKVFTQYIKSIQRQNSHRANSIFTKDIFSLIYSCLSILELMNLKAVHLANISLYNCTTENTHNFKIFKFNPRRSNKK